MEDKKIVDLFWDRSETAITIAKDKYGSYCRYIAKAILNNMEDVEECVNDVLLKAWNTIPPNMPQNLAAYLGKLTRTTAIDCFRKRSRKCRGGVEFLLAVEELEESIPNNINVEKEMEGKELSELINRFLGTISECERNVFVCRYWYMESITKIAKKADFSESKIKSMLFRTRKRLKAFLEKEGYYTE